MCVCFTINNYSYDDFIRLSNLLNCGYMVVGAEVGDSGTPHLQGYIEFTKRLTFKQVKELLGDKAHFEARRGTQEEASIYCMKEGDFIEIGQKKMQGERKDLDRIRQVALDSGMRSVTRIGNIQQIKVAEKYLDYNEEPRDYKPVVWWLYGKTGSGKSRKARELFGEDDYYCKNDGTKWWNGYDGHENVVIDDFRPSWWSLTEMLSLLDRYGKTIEYKGGIRQFKGRLIVITSAKAPSDCYAGCGEDIAQLLRRVDFCQEVVCQEVAGNTILQL